MWHAAKILCLSTTERSAILWKSEKQAYTTTKSKFEGGGGERERENEAVH